MTRVVVLTIFTLIIIAVLNLRGSDTSKISKNYFNIDEYEKNYLAEKNLQEELANPVEEEHDHEKMMAEMEAEEKEESSFIVTTEAEFKDGSYQVKMLNKGANGEKMVFEPMFLKIKPGDKVTFIPADKGHMSQTISGGVPEGASEFASKVNEAYTQTFTSAGVHAIKCKPHFTMGMIAMIVVGDDPKNISQMEDLPVKGNKGKKRWEAMLGELRQLGQQ
jgi:pseudoazurin